MTFLNKLYVTKNTANNTVRNLKFVTENSSVETSNTAVVLTDEVELEISKLVNGLVSELNETNPAAMMLHIDQASNKIAMSTRRGAANVLFASANMCNKLKNATVKIPMYETTAFGDDTVVITYAGKNDGGIAVVSDDTDKIIGYSLNENWQNYFAAIKFA